MLTSCPLSQVSILYKLVINKAGDLNSPALELRASKIVYTHSLYGRSFFWNMSFKYFQTPLSTLKGLVITGLGIGIINFPSQSPT